MLSSVLSAVQGLLEEEQEKLWHLPHGTEVLLALTYRDAGREPLGLCRRATVSVRRGEVGMGEAG